MRNGKQRMWVGTGLIGAGLVAAGLVAAAAGAVATVEAQGPRAGATRGSMGGPRGTLPPLGRLDLSETQRTEIRALVATQTERVRSTAVALREARAALHDAVTTDVVNEGEIRARAAAVATLEADAAVARAYLHAEVWQRLTPDQQARATEIEAEMRTRRAERRQRMEERREERRGRGRGPDA